MTYGFHNIFGESRIITSLFYATSGASVNSISVGWVFGIVTAAGWGMLLSDKRNRLVMT